ncbi:MAG: hypothetical protein FWG69_04140 [Oscillospiraceae bacterium]|nr:hypothetical protein [Oscillospiraceae bacterium]
MYIDKITNAQNTPVVFCAKVTGSSGQNTLNASGDLAVSGVSLFYPYGIYSLPPNNQTVLLTQLGGAYGATGCLMPSQAMNRGEICIFSSGGARIRLLNTGEIFLNATRIAPG